MCARKTEEKLEQKTVNAHGEDSSENRLIIMGSLKVLKVYRLRSYLINGDKSNLLFMTCKTYDTNSNMT